MDAVIKERDMSRSPLFQVMFDLQNNVELERDAKSLIGIELLREDFGHTTSKFDLVFSVEESSQGLAGNVEYCRDLYCEKTIHRMASHYL